MLWSLVVIIVLVVFILFLVFRMFAMQVTLNDAAYSLVMQNTILRDLSFAYMCGYPGVTTSELIFNSFWTQGIVGDLLIERHRLFLAYIEARAGRDPPPWTGDKWHEAITHRIHDIDVRLMKSIPFDVDRASLSTLNMINSIFTKNYNQSLLAVRGLLTSIH